jgi:hypothetical protein
MATIALRVPTIEGFAFGGAVTRVPAGGHCYIVFPQDTISVRELIEEKVRAECRKVRAAGTQASNIDKVTGIALTNLLTPELESILIKRAIMRFEEGAWVLVVDGNLVRGLDTIIPLTRRTGIMFFVPEMTTMDDTI